MSVSVVGLSHKTAPVEVRERISFGDGVVPRALLEFRDKFPTVESLLLSTCNRVEIYTSSADEQMGPSPIAEFIGAFHNVPRDLFEPYLYHHEGRTAVRHLFFVTCGLDAMVVGEAEILGQVKRAYTVALDEGCTGKVLNSLFQKAFNVAKRLRSETRIGQKKVSVASVAADFAQRIFTDLSDKTVMIIGAGETAELTLHALSRNGAKTVIVANRTYGRAVELAESCGGRAVQFESCTEEMHRADIIISTSGAPHALVRAEQIPRVMEARDNRPILIIDLAVPRDVEPAVGDLDNVHLYDIDDLQSVVNENIGVRESEMDKCAELIDRQVERFMARLNKLDVGETIKALRERMFEVRGQELDRLLAGLPHVSGRDKEQIARLTERIINRILGAPTNALVKHAGRAEANRFIETARELFDLNDEEKKP